VAVHGGSGVSYGVIEQLRAARPDAKFLELVHRLDRETSGLLLLAKKRSALTNLHEQMRDGQHRQALPDPGGGDWKNARQHVKLPLHKYTTADGERRVAVQAGGMEVAHGVQRCCANSRICLLEAELKTGRTHQIRVHLASSGFPSQVTRNTAISPSTSSLQKADATRGALKRMFLHAHQITFTHPETGKPMTLNGAAAAECERFLVSLGQPLNNRALKHAGIL
jgi:23S rRNA pseudouridine955/2504/2580 synthase